MNVLLILSDTLRKHYCRCYGYNDWVQTPYIDALAERGTLFTNYYCGNFPTRPMRKDLHSGRFTFPYTAWGGNWDQGEVPLAAVLRAQGCNTALIGDTPSNGGFEEGFDHFEVIPGQNGLDGEDTYPLPADPRKLRIPVSRVQRLLRKVAHRQGEEDTLVARSMRRARVWLEQQYKRSEPFFLFVDTFDPHEPWDPPQYYLDRYDPDYMGDELLEPAYEPADYATPAEIEHMRKMYAAEVSLVDRWIGYLLSALDDLGRRDDTLVLLTTDHGFYHGEHNLIGKLRLDRENKICGRWPLYDTIASGPLVIAGPGIPAGERRDCLVQPADLMPSMLEYVGAPLPATVQGKSVKPIIEGQEEKLREAAVSSCNFLQDDEVRSPSSFRTRDHLYVYGGDEWQSELYDLRADPEETRNVLGDNVDLARDLHRQYLEFLGEIQCPPERIEGRREFRPQRRADVPYVKVL